MTEDNIVREDGPAIQYRDIPGFPGYLAGSDGSIWSSRRLFRPGASGQRRRLKTSHTDAGYLVVGLRPVPGGPVRMFYVHRLVLLAFVGPCPPGHIACHANDDPADNRLENIRWDTRQANHRDADRNGRIPHGNSKVEAKLHERDIPVIDRLRSQGLTFAQIARAFGVSPSSVRAAFHRRTWKHV